MQLKNFLSLTPTYVFSFFNTFIVENFKNIIDLLLLCPDKVVRSVVETIIAHSVNILISFYDLPLDLEPEKVLDEEKTKINQAILDFLSNYLSLLPNDVAKNWNKFQQYFDVILLFLLFINLFIYNV